MKKILYIVSTLKRTGPSSQLSYIIKYLDSSKFEPYILALSPEPKDSLWKVFEDLGVNLYSLNLSRVQGVFLAKKRVLKYINRIQPDIIHTQGVRADSVLSSLSINTPWLLTCRNYPFEGQVLERGKLIGNLFAKQHINAMRKCKNVVACAKNIAERLQKHNVNAIAIQNGSEFEEQEGENTLELQCDRPIFITAAHLSKLKNNTIVIEAFNKYFDNGGKGSLIMLGDGKERQMLQDLSKHDKNIIFLGNVNNVLDYFEQSDFFLSASLSEGLPNSVLEALFSGLPVLLSDIPAHKEIACEVPEASRLFPLNQGADILTNLIKEIDNIFPKNVTQIAKETVKEKFSALRTSQNYQNFYLKITQ